MSEPPLDTLGELKRAIWRIVSYDAGEGTVGYLLSGMHVDEITGEAHEYAQSLASAERERCAQLLTARGCPNAADLLREQP